MVTIEQISTFCKTKGFVYPNSEIYGGFSGFFDYGPLGVELKNNIKNSWWQTFVKNREDIVGIDGATITHPDVWKASGHVDCFTDFMIYCKKNKRNFRADQLIEDVLKINVEGKEKDELLSIIKKNEKAFEASSYDLDLNIKDFNLMFKTNIGQDSYSYLRPETAQLIFTNFRIVFDTMRQKLPFGIAQVGKAYRNEISPRDFLFRSREFEQMEIEFFSIDDDVKNDENYKFNFLSARSQENDNKQRSIFAKELLQIARGWHVYWLRNMYQWFIDLGIKPENLRIREHMKDELAHYSSACFDIEYKFPFGWKEIHGNADRGDFDLKKHMQFSKKSMEIYDEQTKQKILPKIIEPSQGLDRAFLALLFDAYNEGDGKDRDWIILKLSPKIAPIQIGVFPLTNKLHEKAREVFDGLKDCYTCIYDKSGAIGRRYARADEQAIPFCITVDFDTLEDDTVTIRYRDDATQERINIDELKMKLFELLT